MGEVSARARWNRFRIILPHLVYEKGLRVMTTCSHSQLVLLPDVKKRLRCRHCDLTIDADDLTQKYCPECYERDHRRRYDFDDVAPAHADAVRYRCEQCGVLIESH